MPAAGLGEDHARAARRSRPARPPIANDSSCRPARTGRRRSTWRATRSAPSRSRPAPRSRSSSRPGRASVSTAGSPDGDRGWRRWRDPRVDGEARGGAAGRGGDAQHLDRQPAPAAGDVLPAGRLEDVDPHRRPDVPIRPIRRRIAAAPARSRPGERPHRRAATGRRVADGRPTTSRRRSTSTGAGWRWPCWPA